MIIITDGGIGDNRPFGRSYPQTADNKDIIMQKKKTLKKIILGTAIGLFGAVLLCVIGFVCLIFDQPMSFINGIGAEIAAANYYYDKYGENFSAAKAEKIYGGGGPFSSNIGMRVYGKDGIEVIMNNDKSIIADNRQYDDILADYTEKYLPDVIWGENSDLGVTLDFNCGIENYTDEYASFSAKLYDGDIDKFLSENTVDVSLSALCPGEPSRVDDYDKIIEGRLSYLDSSCRDLKALVQIIDPTLSEDIPLCFRRIFYYRNYFIDEIVRTKYTPIDEYTAVYSAWADKPLPLVPTDMGDNLTAYPISGDEVFSLQKTAYKIDSDDPTAPYRVFARFDRKHYNISDSTVPLLVSDVITEDTHYNRSGDWVGKRVCEHAGINRNYREHVPDGIHYYIDENYLYLFCGSIDIDTELPAYIAFGEPQK